MRAPPVLAAIGLASLLACHDDEAPPGLADGAPCSSAAECSSALCFKGACASSYAASALCTPPGAPAIVLGPAVTVPEPPPATCVLPLRGTVPPPPGEWTDLGEHPAGTTLAFGVPAGTTGFSILSQAVTGASAPPPLIVYQGFGIPNSVVPTDVRQPDGAVFYSDTEPFPMRGRYADVTRVLAFYGGWTPVSGELTVPNTGASLDLDLAAGQLPPGTWSFTVNDFARECLSVPGCAVPGGTAIGSYRVQVHVRQKPFASTGTLDLDVYLATDPATSLLPKAAAAVANPQFARWVKSFAAYYARAGICLGTVTVHDLPAWVKTRYAPGGSVDVSGGGQGLPPSQTPPGCDDLSQLFTTGVAPSPGVHLFFADELVDRTLVGRTVLGVDGSIPGPSGAPGTVNGGAVVGIFDLLGGERSAGACGAPGEPNIADCGTDVLALVSAHEAGHWLGLYHTTEFDGVHFDPLSDTAACPCLACAPFPLRGKCSEVTSSGTPTEVVNSYCSGRRAGCGGGRNLMFWLFDERFSVGEISRQQGEVMRQNPAVH